MLNTANAMDSSPRYAQTEETITQVKQAAAALTTSKAFAFALIGDLPYFNDMRETRELIDDINSHRDSTGNIQFVMHAGDIKAGKSPCTDELIKERFTLFSGFNSPFILKSDATLLSMEINNFSLSFFVHHSPFVIGLAVV